MDRVGIYKIGRSNTIKPLAYCVLVTLLFQLFMSAMVLLNPNMVNQTSWLNSALGDKVLICSAEGFKWVDANALIETNQQVTSLFDSSADVPEHEPLALTCPLLDACQYYLFISALLIIVLSLWLTNRKLNIHHYQYLCSLQKVYLHLAPKASPPTLLHA